MSQGHLTQEQVATLQFNYICCVQLVLMQFSSVTCHQKKNLSLFFLCCELIENFMM